MAPVGIAPPAHRYLFLDGLRGIAALAIVVRHFSSNSGHREFFSSASVGVDLFFCLSGFVIAHAYQDRLLAGMPLRDYILRRITRLYPMYLVGLLMGGAALCLMKAHGLTNMTWSSIVLAGALNALYLPYLNHYAVQIYAWPIPGAIFPLNNPAWSLFYGMVANFIYAATLRNSRIKPVAWMAVFAVGLPLAAYTFGTTPGWGTDNFIGGLPRVLYAFFAGVFVFQVRDRLTALPRFEWTTTLALVMAMFLVPRFPGYQFYWLACSLLVVPLLVALAARAPVGADSPWRAAFGYSGRLSYPVFCVHYPLLMVFSATLSVDDHYVLVGLAFIVSTVLLADLSSRFIERPLRDLLWPGRVSP
ncbi:MAG: acyltransferase [Lysobacter sp.]|nr:acyltransferase [Lysobacter sp.]